MPESLPRDIKPMRIMNPSPCQLRSAVRRPWWILAACAAWPGSPAFAQQPERDPATLAERIRREDANRDGTVTREEFKGPARMFDLVDRDRDGMLTATEIKDFAQQRSLPANAQSAPPPRLPEGAAALRDVAYVENGHERQKLDLYIPRGGSNLPLVVWIHGGAWRGGSKERCPALPLLEQGFAVASVNYRLSQHALFPAQIEDCKAAIRWLRDQAPRHGLAPDRIGVWGGSAGGHLVALLGTSGDVKQFDTGPHTNVSSRVQAVCNWFGPSDLNRLGAQSGPDSRFAHDAPDSPGAQLLGGAIPDQREKAAQASPITYVSADDPPFLHMHGEKDTTVPVGQSQILHQALRRAGVNSELVILPGAGHGGAEFNTPEMQAKVRNFFVRELKPAAGADRRQP